MQFLDNLSTIVLNFAVLVLGALLLLRIFTGADASTILKHFKRRPPVDDKIKRSLGIAYMGKFSYPIVVAEGNKQLKSEPYELFSGGVQVTDDYAWLEHKGEQRDRWIKEQEKCTAKILRRNIGMSRGSLRSFDEKLRGSKELHCVDSVYQRGQNYFVSIKIASTQLSRPSCSLYRTDQVSADVLAQIVEDAGKPKRRDLSQGSDSSFQLVLSSREGKKNREIIGTWVCSDGHSLAYVTQGKSESDCALSIRTISEDESKNMLDIDTLQDGIHSARVSVAWADAKVGFFYTKTEGDISVPDHAVYFHLIGKPQKEDILILRSPERRSTDIGEFYSVETSVDGNYIIITVYDEGPEDHVRSLATEASASNRGSKVYCLDLTSMTSIVDISKAPLMHLVNDSTEHCWQYIANIDRKFWFRTNYQADNFRVVTLTLPDVSKAAGGSDVVDLMQSAWDSIKDCIPEDMCLLESASVANHSILVLRFKRQQHHEVTLYDLHSDPGASSNVPVQVAQLPKSPCDGIEGPWCDYYCSSIFYRTTNFADPGCVWRARLSRDSRGQIFLSFEPLFTPEIQDFSMHDYETTIESFPVCGHDQGFSACPVDGPAGDTEEHLHLFGTRAGALRATRVRRVSKVGVSTALGESDQTASGEEPVPCVLFVYGGFDMGFAPSFSSPLSLYVKHYGAIVAVLRVDMTNSDRAVACILHAAEHLVAKGITSLRRLGLFAGTSSATACAIALNQRPDLFGAAVLQDGLYDLMRIKYMNKPRQWYPKSDKNGQEPQGSWLSEFGDAEASKRSCLSILGKSPLHNIRAYWVRDDELCYPAILLQATDTSPVNNAHSFKFAAQLQRIWGSNERADNPIIVSVDSGTKGNEHTRISRALTFLATFTHAEYNE